MKFVMYQDCVSPHQVPLARELAMLVGADNFRYVYRDEAQSGRVSMGWAMDRRASWFLHIGTAPDEAKSLIENAAYLLMMFRDVGLIKRRREKGLETFVQTERWFKPKVGILRLLSPSYRRMAREFVRLMDDGAVVYLPMGIHAARDMARLCGLMHGDLRCLLHVPRLDFEQRPGGVISLTAKNTRDASSSAKAIEDGRKYCLDKMRMWGYFVESGKGKVGNEKLERARFEEDVELKTQNSKLKTIKVLWVGRLLDWKRVDTIIRAAGELSNKVVEDSCSCRKELATSDLGLKTTTRSNLKISLDIYGTGPEETRLEKMASKYGDAVRFHPPVPIGDVRRLMREHDVYVLSSNGYEGWGAVVSEALEDGMRVIGTYEAGSSATMLPEPCLFHAGDWRVLMKLLQGNIPKIGIGTWTAKKAADFLVEHAIDMT